MEYRRKDGHPDFVYYRQAVETFKIEESKRNELIKQAIDRMMHPEKYGIEPQSEIETDKSKRLEILIREESELNELNEPQKEQATPLRGETITTGNKYGHRFVVPKEVYSNAEYREYLDHAETMKSVKVIVDEYYRKHKKHWWQ
jgi:hypothetical protein